MLSRLSTARRALGAFVLLIGLVVSGAASADVAGLRARLDALGTIAESESDLARAAGAALDRAEADRQRGDEAAAVRAEHIAEATLARIERQRARTEAETALAAARARRDVAFARRDEARAAADAALRERARLAPGATP